MPSTHLGSLVQALSIAPPPDSLLDENSAHHRLGDTAGIHVSKTLTLNGNGATTTNLFQVTGSCNVGYLFAFCTEATDSTTLSNVKFELDDGTAQSDITSTVNASGAVAGAVLFKEALVGSPLTFINPTAGVVTEPAANKKLFEPFMLTQKTGGVATYVRVSYTGDATSDTDWEFEMHYVPLGENASIVAV
jgi:hypothetical protein